MEEGGTNRQNLARNRRRDREGVSADAVIASEAKQSSFLSCRAMDCFVALLLAMTARTVTALQTTVSTFAWISMDNATDIPRSRRYINPPGTASGLLAFALESKK
jgi:hypothetical protein